VAAAPAQAEPKPARSARKHRFFSDRLALPLLAAGAAIEALLLLRLWAQLTDRDVQSGVWRLLFLASDLLVRPFRSFDPETTLKQTGIFQVSTLVAIEAYLVGTAAALLLLYILPRLLSPLLALLPHAAAEPARDLSAVGERLVFPERPF
jgi:hypothetical protein